MKIRVYYEDTDLGGVVYHANYLKFCERARSEVFFKDGKNPFTEEGHFLVRSANCKFISPATLGDELEVTSCVTEIKGASFSMTQKVFKDEKELFSVDLNIAYVGGGRPKKIPKEVRDLIQKKFSS